MIRTKIQMTWTDEQLEEMGLVEPFDKALFLSGVSRHSYNSSDISGYIVTENTLQLFAKLLIEEHEKQHQREKSVVTPC